ncbi:MAG: hypothetical protein JKX99_05330 [Robiginitomaculum sp.]|nr:hypothetical protein [Robiginitomaculum sp.]
MSKQLHCATHGTQPASYVCTHIVKAMQTGELAGFFWGMKDGEYDALCEVCNDMSPAEWVAQQEKLLNVLCLGCFKVAADQHGIELVEES